jgi:hypothetical protein
MTKTKEPATGRAADATIREALGLLARRCPRLLRSCFWAGTAAISTEELHHRQSLDIELRARRALLDVRPLLAEVQRAFPRRFELLQAPDEFGSGFRGVLKLPDRTSITVEVLSNFEDVPEDDLVRSTTRRSLLRVSLARYLADKIQCVAERREARDLIDLMAIFEHDPALQRRARFLVSRQDLLLLTERLLGWTNREIRADLAAYPDVDPKKAMAARALLLQWTKPAATHGRRSP